MFNKERVKGLVAGALIGAVVTGAAGVFAYTDYIEAVYNDIKIVVDGQQITPNDGNGKVVEPFISYGTTYLPVRAIANAFGKEADWDGETNTVILGAKSFDWLDQMGYHEYDNSHSSDSSMKPLESNSKASDGTKYNRGLYFYLDSSPYWKYDDGTVDNYQTVSYKLDGKYKTFSGTLCGLSQYRDVPAIVRIYGDGKELYTSPLIANGTKSLPFEIDISSNSLLTIKVEFANQIKSDQYIGIADARLARK
ncbi:MAG: NPCBM/NEW2 domain-containing protein [Clostridia bacterium]|nr:NPCBM/NEW2 domain-containing protein [Clostridia bacterium]MBQ6529711.1 NPCBM/NEW2 domain-containing protein [Clostridia bacterium]MBQ7574180.1 NPCBM/NEW2 domain-containing protein [Clostridia bacterium]